MIKPTLELIQNESVSESFVFIANYHSLNGLKDAVKMKQHTFEIAATFISLGLDPEKTTFYLQSDISETFELSTILATVTPKGLMNRAHAYKAFVDKNIEDGKEDVDVGINMGLYTYPILMASDILLFHPNIIPVGKDQTQHVEFARDIAGSFNHLYGNALTLPKHKIQKDIASIPGLDGRKMSKSYGNTIPLFAEPKVLRKLVMKIVTDSKLPAEPKDPSESTIFKLYQNFASSEKIESMKSDFLNGNISYGDAKQLLFEVISEKMEGPREVYNELLSDKMKLSSILKIGAEKAREEAGANLLDLKERIGVTLD